MKRQKIDGFSEEITAKRIKKMKDWLPAGNWRAFKMLRINYTYLNRVWKNTLNAHTVKETYVKPFGMVTLSSILSHKKCYNTFNVLPEQVKSEVNFTEQTFNKTFVSLDVSREGSKGYAEFNVKDQKVMQNLITYISLIVLKMNYIKCYIRRGIREMGQN